MLGIKEECEVKINKKKKGKKVRQLMQIKRQLKKEKMHDKTNLMRRKLINKHIIQEEQQRYSKKIKATIENLRGNGGGMKEETFWEFKRKLNPKTEEKPTAMKNDKNPGNL